MQEFLPSDVYLESISNISVLLSNLWPDSPNTSHHLANPRYVSQNQSSQLWRLVFHRTKDGTKCIPLWIIRRSKIEVKSVTNSEMVSSVVGGHCL